MAAVVGELRPYPGIAVGLKLHLDRQCVALGFRRLHTGAVHLVGKAKQVLDMMADLMRDHVSLGEVSGGAEFIFQLLIE